MRHLTYILYNKEFDALVQVTKTKDSTSSAQIKILKSPAKVVGERVPEAPTTPGTYRLTVVVNSEGKPTYSWELQE